MTLETLLRDVTSVNVQGPLERSVRHVTRDSREVGPESVFVAVVGARVDGHDYAGDLDCAAVVVERSVEARPGVAVVYVQDCKLALAECAAALHGHPSREVRVLGITGTNGKTTISVLVEGALLALKWPVARIGTIGNAINGHMRPTAFTTPEAPQLQAFLAQLVGEGVHTLVMEVSSIGLSQCRVDGTRFHAAMFTNLTQDHLDFHGTMDAYGASKSRLFTDLLRPVGGLPRAVLCLDDPSWTAMRAPRDHWTYGRHAEADFRIEDSRLDAAGMILQICTPLGRVEIHSPMIGVHNALNLVGALAMLASLDVPIVDAASALGSVPGVPGRLEVVRDSKRLVVVDYAHTPDALEHALDTVRSVCSGRLWVVFGCGGDRDRQKRPQMGRVACSRSDVTVVTSDNPRSESPMAIVEEICAGISGDAEVHVEVDRGQAIGWAIAQMASGDALLIAGKGHETTQEISGVKTPFDDRVVAASALGAS